MTVTIKQWNTYQKAKASLSQEQQNVLSNIEWYMARMGPGVTLTELEIFNDLVTCWRGRNYSSIENHRFLLDLAKVNLCAPDREEFFVRYPFDSVEFQHRNGKNMFLIRPSEYFSEVIGAYIRDRKEA